MYEFGQVALEGLKITEAVPTDGFPMFATIEIRLKQSKRGVQGP